MGSGAHFSDCRRYRFGLWREWGDATKRLVVLGVNPSKADEVRPDHTISKLLEFGRRWGFGELYMLNLFPYVSTDVLGLLHEDARAMLPENDRHIGQVVEGASRIVFAWGKHPSAVKPAISKRAFEVKRMVMKSSTCEIGTFGYNGDGSPKHPLMLPYTTPFLPLERT